MLLPSLIALFAGGGLLAQGKSLGNKIIIGGLFIQIIFFGLFIITSTIFHRRMRNAYPFNSLDYHRSASDGGLMIPSCWKTHLKALYFVSALILTRSIYRVVEYIQSSSQFTGSGGSSGGYIMTHEWTLYAFDFCLMYGTMVILFWWHPSEINMLLKEKSMENVDGGRGIALRGWKKTPAFSGYEMTN